MLLPVISLIYSLLLLKMKPEPAKGINKLIILLSLTETERSIFHHKIAAHQGFQHLGKITIRIQTGMLCYLLTGETCMAGAQKANNLHTVFGIIKHRIEKPAKLILQLRMTGKEQGIYVLSQTIGRIKEIHIERNSAHNHIGLRNIITGHPDATALIKLLTFFQCKRRQFDFTSQTPV